MNAKIESNLRKLAKTSLAMNFVKKNNGEWNHQNWLDFLAEIKRKGYEPIDPAQVGLLLEEKKAQYLTVKA